MTGENCSVKNVKIAYVGGGSHAWAWVFMNDLAKETVLSGTVRLYDIDAEAAENNRKIGTRLFEREDVKGNFKFETSASPMSTCRSAMGSTSPWATPQGRADWCGRCAPSPCMWRSRRR